MRGKDFLALTVGFNIVGGVLAGLLVGYAFDIWLMEGLFGKKLFPLGSFSFSLLV